MNRAIELLERGVVALEAIAEDLTWLRSIAATPRWSSARVDPFDDGE